MTSTSARGIPVPRRLRLPAAIVVSLAFLGAACGSSSDSDSVATTTSTPASTTGSITVSAAASLTEPFRKIADDFEAANPGVTDVKLNFDASGTLVKQIQDGAAVDSFASADEANMAKLVDAGLVEGSPQVFARNKMTIVVKKGNPREIRTLADLASGPMVSLCGADVPCGKYADQMLQQAGVTIPTDKITRGQHAKGTLTAVADGDADAGIVYVTDVSGDKVEAVPVPDSVNVIADYPIAVLKASTNGTTAEAFMAYVLSDAGQATRRAAGFLPPG